MIDQGYISQIEAQDAFQEEQSPTFFKSSPTLQDQAPHFDDYILAHLEQMFHLKRSQLSRSVLIVSTTLNIALQQKILPILRQHIAEVSSPSRFHGHPPLRCALSTSLNVPAVRVLQQVGVNHAEQTAENMGITTPPGTPGLGMVLGSRAARLPDPTSPYGIYANGGVRD